MTDRPNVILLTIDALRADHVGCYGYERDTTPFLDSFAEENVQFATAISASSHTREAMPALLSGQYPDVFAANGYRCVTETIADRLSDAGYHTAGFHSNPYLSRAYGFDSGFDTFYDDLTFGQNRIAALVQRALDKFLLNKGEYHARADEINRRSLEWLNSLDDGPWFLWNHYMDVHGPYNPPEGYTKYSGGISDSLAHDLYQKCIKRPEAVTSEERNLLIDCYDDEIRYLDAALSEFFDELKTRGVVGDSLIIVTADHGDAFGEHGYYSHPRYLHDELIHVPLFISAPYALGTAIKTPVSSLDLVPMMLGNGGVDATTPDLPGIELLTDELEILAEERRVVFACAQGEDAERSHRRFAARGQRFKAIVECDVKTRKVLTKEWYDLEKDPEERYPITNDDVPESAYERLTKHANRQIRQQFEHGVEAPDHRPAAEVRDRLDALGYR